MDSDDPPDDLAKFFQWLRIRTEELWATLAQPSMDDFRRRGVGGVEWQRGTRWLWGLSASEIDAIEHQWGLQFPNDYRLFLQMLHAPDRPMFTAGFQGRMLVEGTGPSFFNWLTDGDAIRRALKWPIAGLVFDVFHDALWPDDWGPRPKDEEEAIRRLEVLTRSAPKLVPVIGHRYLVETDSPRGYIVLSVYQSDIIVYASSLRDLMLKELIKLVGKGEIVDEADESDVDFQAALRIPFWGRFLE